MGAEEAAILAPSHRNAGTRSRPVRVRFGPFVLDADSRQLIRGGAEVPLSPKAVDLLIFLATNRPRALTKQELHQRLWPDTFVVDANLTNLVAELRKALDDDAREPRFVRTVHRYGYAFAADATEESVATAQRQSSCSLAWTGGRATLGEGEHLIGRELTAAVCIRDPSVSRHHARLRIAAGAATLEDLGSKNATLVNDDRISAETPLADGDAIVFGSVRAIFRSVLREPSTQTVGFKRS